MIRLFPIAGALALTATLALAQQGTPGAHFIDAWDLDGDGQVSLAEATERRGDVFAAFDADEDGVLSPEEHDLFDEARANDMRDHGIGGSGGGPGNRHNPANCMLREVTDADGDGQVTREEFMQAVPAWYAVIDRNGDGTVTAQDFGRRGN
ncbi:EF-hand domain-containing protein [Marimonas lutisalis]|uniref:EF-hand domain-containing protein n=1 Tax=Marimonas lutisalis TaxID=2545756 RepID=UPI0010F7ECFC|nr:EF-hand domain-containing protein [Marimonas lutisalis]